MTAATAQVTASKPSRVLERVISEGLDADAGVVPLGALVGRNSAGYFINANASEALTDIGLNISPTVEALTSNADAHTKIKVLRGAIVPFKISTLGTDAAARAQYRKPVYVAYNNEVSLSRGYCENFVGIIVGHNSVTEVLVYIPLTGQAGQVLDFSRFTPGSEIDGCCMTTGNNWIEFSVANARGFKQLFQYTCATGEFNAWCLRARSNSVAPVVCVNAEGSSGQNDHGNLFGVQAFATANHTQSNADNICCALYARNTRPVGKTSVGRDWVLWVDTQMVVKASGGSYLARFSHNGTVAADGLMTIYIGGRMDYFINFEDVSGFLSVQNGGSLTLTHKLLVNVAGAARYIVLGTV